MAPGKRVFDRLRLMRVEALDAARLQRLRQSRVESLRKGRELRRDFGQPPDCSDVQIWRVRTLGQAAGRQTVECGIEGAVARGTCGKSSTCG